MPKKVVKSRAEIKEAENRNLVEKTKSYFFEKIIKIDNPYQSNQEKQGTN
jgi:hypothetical protein